MNLEHTDCKLWKGRYYELLDIIMNIFLVMELEKEKRMNRRRTDRLYLTFKKQVDDQVAKINVLKGETNA